MHDSRSTKGKRFCRIFPWKPLPAREGVEQNDKQAFSLFLMAASDKISPNAYAMYQLGGMYQNGIGTEQDLKESERWYQCAYQGFLSLEEKSRDDKLWYRLGQMNMAGIGTAVNLEAAKLYFNRSAGYGNTDAEYGLGCLYANPDFSEYNIPKSIEHFFKAAEAQNQFAQYQLGKLYLGENEDIPKDIEKALSFLQLSADQGNQFAQYQLGRLYLGENEDIPRNIEKALSFLSATPPRYRNYRRMSGRKFNVFAVIFWHDTVLIGRFHTMKKNYDKDA